MNGRSGQGVFAMLDRLRRKPSAPSTPSAEAPPADADKKADEEEGTPNLASSCLSVP